MNTERLKKRQLLNLFEFSVDLIVKKIHADVTFKVFQS